MKLISIFFDEGRPLEIENVRPLSGVRGLYFIYNKDIEIRYPFGESKLIYIGMSEKKTNSIGKRLQGHMEGTSRNQGILGYMKANDLNFTYLNFEMLKSNWTFTVEDLESIFILSFVEKFGVYPICNNKTNFNITKEKLIVDFKINWEYFS